MAEIKGDLEIGKNLNVAVKATINSNDSSETLVVGGTAKFVDVKVSSSQGSFSLPLSAGVSGQLLISTGSGGRFNWRDPDETIYLTETSANNKFLQISNLEVGGIISTDISGLSVKLSAADKTPTFTTTNLGAGQQLALTVSANRDFRFRTITGNGVIDVKTSGNLIEVSASDNGKLKAEIIQSAHSFTNNQVIYLDSQDSLWKLAIANDATKMGIAVVANATTNTFDALFGGTISISGLSPGNYYFTSDVTPGAITVSAPDNINSFINPILYAVSNTIAVILPWRPNSVNDTETSNLLTTGFRTIWQPAGSMLAKITNGAQYITREVGSSQVLTPLYTFSKSVNQSVQFSIAMPRSWDEGTVNYQIIWSKNTGIGGNVVWGVRAMALGDGDAIDGTWGTQVTVTDNATANNNEIRISNISNDLTIGNSPQENDLVIFEITRNSNNIGDTFAENAELVGIRLFININQTNDNF